MQDGMTPDLHGADWKAELAPKPKPKKRSAAEASRAGAKRAGFAIAVGASSAPTLGPSLSAALFRRQSRIGTIPMDARSVSGLPNPTTPGRANNNRAETEGSCRCLKSGPCGSARAAAGQSNHRKSSRTASLS